MTTEMSNANDASNLKSDTAAIMSIDPSDYRHKRQDHENE